MIARIARCVQDAIDECDLHPKQIRGIGVGAPGAVDPDTGAVIFAPNLKWEDVPFQKALAKQLDLPVFAENALHMVVGINDTYLANKLPEGQGAAGRLIPVGGAPLDEPRRPQRDQAGDRRVRTAE